MHSPKRFLTPGLLVFLSTLAVFSLCLNSIWAADHPTSFVELDWAMWSGHSFVLGNAHNFKPGTVDDFVYNGNYYSALAPGAAVLALPFVGLGFYLQGHYDLFHDVQFLSELFVALMNALASMMVYFVGRLFFSKRVSVFLAFTYAFSTISWPFSTYFFQSDVSALFDLLAAYFALRVVKEGRGTGSAIAAGAAVAVAITVDYINAVLITVVLSYIALGSLRQKRPFIRTSLAFVCVAVLGILLILLYDYVNFGSPFRTSEQLYLNSSSIFKEFSYPLYLGALLNLFSAYRGLFIYSVSLVLGLFGFYEMFRESPYRREGLFLLACFLAIFIPYSMWYDPGGGEAFGPRFLIAAIPFLLLPAGFILRSANGRLWVAAFILFAAGAVVNGIAAVTSAITPTMSFGLSPLLQWTLPLFLSGGIDAWWWAYVDGYWEAVTALIIATAIAIPVVADRILVRSERADLSTRSPSSAEDASST